MPENNLPFPPSSRLVAYCRDSGGRDQDLSIPQQEAKIGEWCKAHGFALVRVFKDIARSGTTTAGRDQFLEMFSYLSRGADVAGVVIWEYARFSRSYDDLQYYLADIRRQGYGLYSLSDQIPEGLEGRLMEGIIAYTNARYSADLSRNVKRGKAYVVTVLHGWPHADVPLGYRKEYHEAGTRRDGTPHQIARLVPDPDTAPIVIRAFAMRAAGASFSEIRNTLSIYNRNSSFTRFLNNPIYTGVYHYGNLHIDNYCPAIVDLQTWEAAQLVNEASRNRAGVFNPRRINSPFLLSGLTVCARCSSPLNGIHTKPKKHLDWYSYYHCPNKPYRRTSDTYCDAPGILKHALEGRVTSRLVDLLVKPQILVDVQAELTKQVQEQDASRKDSERSIRADLEDTQRRISRIVAAISDAGHSAALIADLTNLESKRDNLAERLFAVANKTPPLPRPVDLPALATDLRAAIAQASDRDMQKIFRLCITSVRAELKEGEITGDIAYTIGDVSGVLSL